MFLISLAGFKKKINEEQERINEYSDAKFREETEQKYRRILKQRQQIAYRNELAKKHFDNLPDIESVENECYLKAAQEYAEKWNEQEQKKMEHCEQLKEDRIKYHSREKENMEKLQQIQFQANELDKLDRETNEKIDFVFDLQQRSDKLNKIKSLRQFINQQIELDKKARREELVQNRIDTNRAIESAIHKDDETFFNYATKLMKNAKEKGLPLKPLKKTIDEYKVSNSLLPQKDDLPHLKSHIDIGISMERKYSNKLVRCGK